MSEASAWASTQSSSGGGGTTGPPSGGATGEDPGGWGKRLLLAGLSRLWANITGFVPTSGARIRAETRREAVRRRLDQEADADEGWEYIELPEGMQRTPSQPLSR